MGNSRIISASARHFKWPAGAARVGAAPGAQRPPQGQKRLNVGAARPARREQASVKYCCAPLARAATPPRPASAQQEAPRATGGPAEAHLRRPPLHAAPPPPGPARPRARAISSRTLDRGPGGLAAWRRVSCCCCCLPLMTMLLLLPLRGGSARCWWGPGAVGAQEGGAAAAIPPFFIFLSHGRAAAREKEQRQRSIFYLKSDVFQIAILSNFKILESKQNFIVVEVVRNWESNFFFIERFDIL